MFSPSVTHPFQLIESEVYATLQYVNVKPIGTALLYASSTAVPPEIGAVVPTIEVYVPGGVEKLYADKGCANPLILKRESANNK
jgi:hypothetical protein